MRPWENTIGGTQIGILHVVAPWCWSNVFFQRQLRAPARFPSAPFSNREELGLGRSTAAFWSRSGRMHGKPGIHSA
jgi:hypothetical protein